MKHTHFIFIVAATLALCSCEIKDDRNRPVPENPKLAWLLSVEVDKLPVGVQAYSCAVYNVDNINDRQIFTRTEIKLPELLKIPGAKLLLWEKNNSANLQRQYVVSFFQIDPQVENSAAVELATILVPSVPETVIAKQDTTVNYPQKVSFNINGVRGYFHFRYD